MSVIIPDEANYNHKFESVLAYLDALGASLEVSIFLKYEPIAVVPAKLSIAREATILTEQ